MYSNPDSSGIRFLDESLVFVYEFNSGRIVCLTDGLSNIFFVPRLLDV